MFGTEGNLDMIKKKVLKVKVKTKTKSKLNSKIKAKKVTKKISKKIKNPVYFDSKYKLKKAYDKYHKLKDLIIDDALVIVYSNDNAVSGLLKSERNFDYTSYNVLVEMGERVLNVLNKELYTLLTLDQMPDQDDLSLIAENNDYLGNELFWNEHDPFKKDTFKKSRNFQFILENVDKIIDNRIYVRRLKQVKSK